MRSMKLFGACLALLAIVGCSPKPAAESTAPAVAAAQPKPVASVLDLMLGQIDPAADFLWESVATISTDKGIEERQPRTDAEWAEVRHKALAVIEGANLLMLEGRRVAHPGQQLSEAGGEGDFTPEQSQAAVDADRATYLAYSEAMRGVAELLLAAIEKRDIEAMLENGGVLDETCEQCHRKFWYPNSPLPPGA
ncbi:MAG: hypothetical protein IPH71_00395 [Proteobacteria bacterium]|jgi:hypothetical protein|nr:hypothetical protein [Pseudomonadota bacterium]